MEEKKQNSNAKKIVIGVIVLAVVAAVLIGVYYFFGPKTSQGAKEFTLEVVDDKGETTDYTGHTDAEYLRQALEELEETEDFTLEGDESEYGLYINTVNGITADYDADGAYWSVYVNEEYGNYGIDTQPVTDGDAYKLVYEVYSE